VRVLDTLDTLEFLATVSNTIDRHPLPLLGFKPLDTLDTVDTPDFVGLWL